MVNESCKSVHLHSVNSVCKMGICGGRCLVPGKSVVHPVGLYSEERCDCTRISLICRDRQSYYTVSSKYIDDTGIYKITQSNDYFPLYINIQTVTPFVLL